MSNDFMQVITAQESRFVQLNHANGDLLDFKQECIFARQQIAKNNFIRCAQHGWIQERVLEIEIPDNTYLQPVATKTFKYRGCNGN